MIYNNVLRVAGDQAGGAAACAQQHCRHSGAQRAQRGTAQAPHHRRGACCKPFHRFHVGKPSPACAFFVFVSVCVSTYNSHNVENVSPLPWSLSQTLPLSSCATPPAFSLSVSKV